MQKESCILRWPKDARHASRRASPGDPSEVHRCLKVAEHVCTCCRTLALGTEGRPQFDQLVPCWAACLSIRANVGQIPTNLHQVWSTRAKHRQSLAKSGPSSTKFVQIRTNLANYFGHTRPSSDRIRSNTTRIWPTRPSLVNAGQMLANLGPLRFQLWPQPAKFGRIGAESQLSGQAPDSFRTIVQQLLGNLGAPWERHGSFSGHVARNFSDTFE